MDGFSYPDGVTEEELREIRNCYTVLTDGEAQEIIHRAIKSAANFRMCCVWGCAMTDRFFIPAEYPDVIVPFEDVYAVIYRTDYWLPRIYGKEVLCSLCTNTPHTPVIAMTAQMSNMYFELADMFHLACSNLTYPVMEVEEFKKRLKAIKKSGET